MVPMMPPMMMAVMAMPTVMVVMMMAAPVHLGRAGNLFCTFLHRRCGAGASKRKRQRALCRSSEGEQSADGGKPQNFRHVHLRSPWVHDLAHAFSSSQRRWSLTQTI